MKNFWEWFSAGLCLVGLIFAAMLCYRILPPSTKDFWDIMAAVGSAGAAIAAVWIATRDGRHRKYNEMAGARLAAAGIAFRANFVLDHVKYVLGELDKNELYIYSAEDIEYYAIRLKEGGLWTHEELLLLIPLPNNCARKLAVAAAQVDALAAKMRRTAKEWDEMSGAIRLTHYQGLYATLILCYDRLEDAVDMTKKAAEIYEGKTM